MVKTQSSGLLNSDADAPNLTIDLEGREMPQDTDSDVPAKPHSSRTVTKDVDSREAVFADKLVLSLALILLICIFILFILAIVSATQNDSYQQKVVVGVIVLIVSVLFILWKLPKWQVSFSKNLSSEAAFTLENEARKTLAQILAGIFLLVGIYSTLKTMQISEEAQFAGRLDKVIDQLGSERQHIRIGGIYALIRLSEESEKYRQTSRDLFSAYIREFATYEVRAQENAEPKVNSSSIVESTLSPSITNQNIEVHRREIQILINYLGNPPYLSKGVYLSEGIDLSKAELKGLSFSNCKCVYWSFSDAHLNGAKFDSSELDSANFKNANLKDVSFWSADLSHANFNNADLSGASFDNANLERTKLSSAQGLTSAQIEKARNYEKAELPAVILSELKEKYPHKGWQRQ